MSGSSSSNARSLSRNGWWSSISATRNLMAANLMEWEDVRSSYAAIMHSDKHPDARALARHGFDAEAATGELGPFAHRQQPQPKSALLLKIKAYTIVGNRQRDTMALVVQPDRNALGLG